MIKRYVFAWMVLASGAASADMASQGERAQTAGIDLVTFRTHVKDVVAIQAALPAGDAMAEPGNIAIPTLTGMMLDRGTKSLDKFAIEQQLDDVGARISFGVGTQSLEVRARCLGKDLPTVIGLIAAELREPALSSGEFAKARKQFIGSLEASKQSTEGRAQEAFGRAVFPIGHPNRPHTVDEYIAAAKAAKIDDVRAFHAKYYGPAHLTLVLVGDLPEDARAVVAKAFAGWSGGRDYLRAAVPARSSGPQQIDIPLKGKTSVTIILGQATGLSYRDPDALALRVGTAILGHGFTGRLMSIIRDQEGLTYNISAAVAQDSLTDGTWDVGASFAPGLLEKGIAATRREIEHWWRDGVTQEELTERKQGMVGGYYVSLSTTGGLAGAIMGALQRGYDLNWVDGYPAAVEALTRDQVNQAVRAHIDPEKLALIEAGTLPAATAN